MNTQPLNIQSFMDVILTDPSYHKTYTLVSFSTEMYRDEPVAHFCAGSLSAYTCAYSLKGVETLRGRLSFLYEKNNIILIDLNRKKILTDIKTDGYFLRLAKNTSYELKFIEGNQAQKLNAFINKTIPNPRLNEEELFNEDMNSCNIL